MLHIIWSIIVGFIVGVIARAVMPGADHFGFWITVLIGIGGSLVGGLIGMVVSRPRQGAMFHPAGFFLSIIGALVVIWVIEHFHLLG